VLTDNVIGFAKERGSDFVLGRINGPSALGLYNMGSQLANMPTADLVAPIARAVFPVYAQLSSDPPELRRMFVSVISVTALLSIPAGFGLAALAPLVATVLLGAKWVGSIPVIQIVAIEGVIQSLQSNVYATYLALGRPDISCKIDTLYMLLLLLLTVLLAPTFGIVGAAYAYLVTAAIFGPMKLWVATRMLDLPMSRWVAGVWRPVLSAIVMYATVRPFVHTLSAGGAAGTSGLWQLAVCMLLGVTVYLAFLALLWILSGKPQGAEVAVLTRLLPRRMARE
jgi:O-antigen/teichoic acid export membrane protein